MKEGIEQTDEMMRLEREVRRLRAQGIYLVLLIPIVGRAHTKESGRLEPQSSTMFAAISTKLVVRSNKLHQSELKIKSRKSRFLESKISYIRNRIDEITNNNSVSYLLSNLLLSKL